MGLESVDFQSVVHQQVSQLMQGWQAEGFSEDEAQETAAQFFNMGMIASQQLVQEKEIKVEGSDQTLPYSEDLALRIVQLFLQGLNPAIIKAHEYALPSQEKWHLMQSVAFHLFEQAKQIGIITMDSGPQSEVSITPEQIDTWLSQTATEALLYYIMEYEKQHGPITKNDPAVDKMSEMLNAPQEAAGVAVEAEPEVAPPILEETVAPIQPVQSIPPEPVETIPMAASASDLHHKYAALGLLLTGLPPRKQANLLEAFSEQEKQLIQTYRDPDLVARQFDLGKVAHYLSRFKEKMGEKKLSGKSPYASRLQDLVKTLPPAKLQKLFEGERPFVRGYIQQMLTPDDPTLYPYQLPSGVEEALALYLERNFPTEVVGAR